MTHSPASQGQFVIRGSCYGRSSARKARSRQIEYQLGYYGHSMSDSEHHRARSLRALSYGH